jgi:hypothetical protein
LPAEAYPEYDDLLGRAVTVRRLPFIESTAESPMAASKLMVDETDELYAVWDGKPHDYGGTADVVAYARDHDTAVRVIWPAGAERDLTASLRQGEAPLTALCLIGVSYQIKVNVHNAWWQ